MNISLRDAPPHTPPPLFPPPSLEIIPHAIPRAISSNCTVLAWASTGKQPSGYLAAHCPVKDLSKLFLVCDDLHPFYTMYI